MNQQTREYSPTDALPDFQLRSEMLQRFIHEHMQEGTDFGVIPGTRGRTLLKPGAEKLCIYLCLAPLVEVTLRTEDWETGFLAYEAKVSLMNKRTAAIEAEGAGSCNSRERKYKNQDAANVANTLLKMAKKRAFIDAALAASGAGEMFSDEDENADSQHPQQAPRAASTRDQAPRSNAPQGNAPRENTPRGHYAPTPNAPAADATQRTSIETMAQQLWPGEWNRRLLQITGGNHLAHLDRPAAMKLIAHLRSVATNAAA